jgi:hypothetical protein
MWFFVQWIPVSGVFRRIRGTLRRNAQPLSLFKSFDQLSPHAETSKSSHLKKTLQLQVICRNLRKQFGVLQNVCVVEDNDYYNAWYRAVIVVVVVVVKGLRVVAGSPVVAEDLTQYKK